MARPCPAAATNQRHQPERTVLDRTIATHLPTFFARPTPNASGVSVCLRAPSSSAAA